MWTCDAEVNDPAKVADAGPTGGARCENTGDANEETFGKNDKGWGARWNKKWSQSCLDHPRKPLGMDTLLLQYVPDGPCCLSRLLLVVVLRRLRRLRLRRWRRLRLRRLLLHWLLLLLVPLGGRGRCGA